VEKLGEGTFSEVFKWRCEDKGTQVAVKCMKDMYESMDEVSAPHDVIWYTDRTHPLQALKRVARWVR
jgi:hypothetical protein